MAAGSPHTPIYTSTTFKFPSTQAVLDVVEGRTVKPLYTRYGLNPTLIALEEKLAALVGADDIHVGGACAADRGCKPLPWCLSTDEET